VVVRAVYVKSFGHFCSLLKFDHAMILFLALPVYAYCQP
jgi:hypothetical protein